MARKEPKIKGELRLTGETIELAELLAFRERLEQMTRELVDELSRILSLRPVTSPKDDEDRG
jgi:NTP pyrophosphatase (non-canonical NTP hydrolase)